MRSSPSVKALLMLAATTALHQSFNQSVKFSIDKSPAEHTELNFFKKDRRKAQWKQETRRSKK